MSIPELPHLKGNSPPRREARYGNVPGLPVGSRFTDRAHLYRSGMHVTLQAGIQGRADTGACSVVLSGGYEDDSDSGYEFTYTGHGGQLPRYETDRSQKRDQEWTRGNQALKMSSIFGKPVRVIRGHKLGTKWAPAEGYRYDGLYDVIEYDRKKGKSGFYVCLFKFKRRPDQPPLPEPDWYRAGERPPTLDRITSSNRTQTAQTPPPRAPPPRYSPPADVKAIVNAAISASRQPKKRPLHNIRRTSISDAAFEEGTSRERSSSVKGMTNKLTDNAPMSMSTSGEDGPLSLFPKRQFPSFTRKSYAPPNSNGPPKKFSSTPNAIYSSKSEGSIPASPWKGKQKASEAQEMNNPIKHSTPQEPKGNRISDASMRIQAWNSFYNQGTRSESENDDSDSDGGEFSEGDGISYRDEASDTEQPINIMITDDQKALPLNRRFHEVIEISSDED